MDRFLTWALAGLLWTGAAQGLPGPAVRQAVSSLPGFSGGAELDASGSLHVQGTLDGLPLSGAVGAQGSVLVTLDDADLPPQTWPENTGAAVLRLGGLTGVKLEAALNTSLKLLDALTKLDPAHPPLIAGNGVGGLAVILLLERQAPVAGGLAVCAPVSGWAAQIAYLSDFRLVYNYFTRNLAGTKLPGVGTVTDLTTLATPAQNAASVGALFAGAPITDRFKANLGQIGDVTHVRADADAYRTLLNAFARELPRWQAAYHGFPYSNAGTSYQSSMDDDPMNAGIERPAAVSVAALKALTPTGRWARPLLTLHDLSDPLYPEETEGVLRSRAAASPLAQRTVQNVGALGVQACDLPEADTLRAWRDLRDWVGGGPTPAP